MFDLHFLKICLGALIGTLCSALVVYLITREPIAPKDTVIVEAPKIDTVKPEIIKDWDKSHLATVPISTCVQCCPKVEFKGFFLLNKKGYNCDCVIDGNDYRCECELVGVTPNSMFDKEGKFKDQNLQKDYEQRAK